MQSRQDEIIKQLEQLRVKLNDMQSKLGVVEKPAAVQKAQQKVQKKAPVIKPIDVSYKNQIEQTEIQLLID